MGRWQHAAVLPGGPVSCSRPAGAMAALSGRRRRSAAAGLSIRRATRRGWAPCQEGPGGKPVPSGPPGGIGGGLPAGCPCRIFL